MDGIAAWLLMQPFGGFQPEIGKNNMILFNMKIRPFALYFFCVLTGLISLFFISYSIRLFYVTRFLTSVKPGGQGAFIVALAFPILAIGFGFIAWCCIRAARRAN